MKAKAVGDSFELPVPRDDVVKCELETNGSNDSTAGTALTLLFVMMPLFACERLKAGGTLDLLMPDAEKVMSLGALAVENGESFVAGVPRRDSMSSEVSGLAEAPLKSLSVAIATRATVR